MIQVYHNNRCTKSRNALSYLEDKNIAFEVVYYLEKGFTFEELKSLINKLGIEPLALVRKTENIYKSEFKGKVLTSDQWIQAMVDNPILVERPIVVNDDRAVVARPTENIETIL